MQVTFIICIFLRMYVGKDLLQIATILCFRNEIEVWSTREEQHWKTSKELDCVNDFVPGMEQVTEPNT
jgi:hypothetical protein